MPTSNLTHFVLVDFENVPTVDLSSLCGHPLSSEKGSCCSTLPRLADGLLRGRSKKRLRKRTVQGKVSRRHQGAP
jgi:hypothetical protein